MSPVSQPRRAFLASATVAVAASLPGCSLMSPAAASIIKAAPYVPGSDPLAALIAEYRARLADFHARAETEDWDALLADTYGPPSKRSGTRRPNQRAWRAWQPASGSLWRNPTFTRQHPFCAPA